MRLLPILLLLTAGLAPGCAGEAGSCVADGDCPPGRYCQAGACAYDCTLDSECPAGFRCSARGRCERGCRPTNNSVEACDGIDNDCDDQTDENWPELGQACAFEPCLPGTWVCAADGSASICNARRPAADDATCDGIDDDCDAETDEDAARLCPLQAGVCAGAEQVCQNGAWRACTYGPTYTVGQDAVCDQIDSDCDDLLDEDAAPLPEPETGAAAGNGLDDNCSGVADEPAGVMVRLDDRVAIDAYETTIFAAPNCSGPPLGVIGDDYPAGWPAEGPVSETLYACSLPGRVPSGWLSWYRAQRACEAQGKRLCSADEFERACSGPNPTTYPYGDQFVSGACNDGWLAPSQVAEVASHPACVSVCGAWDLSGNLNEWVADADIFVPDHRWTGGGSWECIACYPDATCRPCDRDNAGDESKFRYILDCQAGANRADQDWDSHPPARAEAWFGGRCCWDLPP